MKLGKITDLGEKAPDVFTLPKGVSLSAKRVSPQVPKMPVCPFCKVEMEALKYEGYYDSFYYWGCDCDELPDAREWQGEYTSG